MHHPLFQRASELIAVEIEGKRPSLSDRLTAIKHKRAAAGLLRSGATLKMLHVAAREELEERSRIAFASFKRAHEAFMPRAREVNRSDAKLFAQKNVEQLAADISPVLQAELLKLSDQKTIERPELTLVGDIDLTVRRLNVEVDLHFDHLDGMG